jgi:AraC family transcriptional regulator, regulatory protein of adaptative response / methylated-DNA-[protein]-cysteine methyltransferase
MRNSGQEQLQAVLLKAAAPAPFREASVGPRSAAGPPQRVAPWPSARADSVLDKDRRWRAVLARDTSFDGTFVYAVRSTGIYCRPWCPSRRPRRKQVVFFSLPAAAEQAGFRPCRRCRPGISGAGQPQVGLIQSLCRYIEEHLEDSGTELSLHALGARTGLSPYHLQRTFKRIMGITPRQYAEARRLVILKAGLKGGKNVTDTLYDAGYGSSSRLYERAPAQLGMTPATYRNGGRNMEINYTIVPCPLGRLLVAATERGVCAVSLGDSEAALEASLVSEYPNARIHPDPHPKTELDRLVIGVLDLIKGSQPHANLPVDVQATAFQWRVWKALCAIPRGATRSYSDIARAIGRPTAVRAVARAIATNPVAVVIPCHRAVHKDGTLSGYRWGPERKKALLANERLPDE